MRIAMIVQTMCAMILEIDEAARNDNLSESRDTRQDPWDWAQKIMVIVE